MNDTTPPANPAPAGESPAFSSEAPTPPPRRKWLTPTLALVAVLVLGVFGGVLIGHTTASSAQGAAASGFPRGPNGGTGGARGFGGRLGGGAGAGGGTGAGAGGSTNG